MFRGQLLQKKENKLRFLCSACHLIELYISIKFHKNTANIFEVTDQKQFCDGQAEGQMDGQTMEKTTSPP